MQVHLLRVRTMRDAFNPVKSIFAMHTSKALNLIFRDTFFARSDALFNARKPACLAVETKRFRVVFPW